MPWSPGSAAAVRFLVLFLVVGAGLSSSLACDEIRVERRGAGASAESTAFLGGILMVRGLVSGGSMWSVRKMPANSLQVLRAHYSSWISRV